MLKIFNPKHTIVTFEDVNKSTSEKFLNINENFAKHRY